VAVVPPDLEPGAQAFLAEEQIVALEATPERFVAELSRALALLALPGNQAGAGARP